MTIELNTDDIVRYLDRNDSMNLIKKVDQKQGCCHFSIEVLRMLINDLQQDMSIQEIAEELGFGPPMEDTEF